MPESPPEVLPGAGADAQFAHELNNLLDGSLRHLSLAISKLGDAEPDARSEEVIEESVRRLHTASEAMRRMAALLRQWMRQAASASADPRSQHSEAGPTGTDPARLYWQEATLGESIGYARRLIEPLTAARDIQLHIDLPPDLADAPAGPLYQVLANALRNAVEAIPEHRNEQGPAGRIDLACRRRGDRMVITIRDDGRGLPDALQRTDNGLPQPGATTKPAGHGMGLAISRRIVESLGGELRLENNPDRGATLTIRWKPPT